MEVEVAHADSFGGPAKGQQMAQAMFGAGADVVFHVAGGTGLGVIEAAEASGHYAIGVDTDQDGLAHGHVPTSMVKRVDTATERLTKAYAQGSFPGGQVKEMGLAEDGVGLSLMTHTRDLVPEACLDRVEATRQGIIDGSIAAWDGSAQGYPDWVR